jgi:hypothetical protein
VYKDDNIRFIYTIKVIMRTYSSVRQIKEGFQVDSDDLQVIRDVVNKIRIENHPDKTNGVFESVEVEEEYLNANNAVMFLDSMADNRSLVTIDKMDLVRAFAELMPINQQQQQISEQNLDRKIGSAIDTYRHKLNFPRISLASISAIVTFIYLFPGQIKDHPTLSKLFDPSKPSFIVIWLIILLYSLTYWLFTFRNEEKAKKRLALLKVDSVQNNLFEEFIFLQKKDNFSKDNLTHFIFNENFGTHRDPLASLVLGFSGIITLDIAQNIAELILARAEKNKVIERVTENTMSETYLIKKSPMQKPQKTTNN